MLAALNEDNVRTLIVYVADKIIESKPLLTEIDSKIGDGDHGIGMAGGLQKAKDKVLAAENTGNAYSLFDKAGKAMLMSMGGASGVIFGSLFLAGAKDADAKAELGPGDLAAMMEKSLAAIKERGKAQVGDKTMVDALEPAVEAMKKTHAEGLVPMLKAAEEAAAAGLESTKNLQAKFGRAKSLMERAIGFQDAGATSVWIIFRSMREFAEQH
ncbi:dihydroxyacetone kinase subunit DhaL [Spirochaetia bacterium]|nr:dihydroxyacetone kinase subunit DhaL [Spirochaetia bacterium]